MTERQLLLRGDVYYLPVRDGVWLRTTEGSFVLRGRGVAAWLARLGPLFDRGVAPEQLFDSLAPAQARYLRDLVDLLEQRRVLRREPPGARAGTAGETRRPRAEGRTAGRATAGIVVAGPEGYAVLLAGALAQAGFRDVVVPAEPDRPTAAELAGRHLVGLFPAEQADPALVLGDRVAAEGIGTWLGLTRGRALLLKGHLTGYPSACPRCAWRRLAHRSVALPAGDGIGTAAPLAAGVLGQEMTRVLVDGDTRPLAEAAVVDLDTLRIWRSAVDVDPTCPAAGRHHRAGPLTPRAAPFPDLVYAARCFGPLASCSPEGLPQLPLTTLRLVLNPLGRAEPTVRRDGPLLVAETMAEARAESLSLAVERHLPAAPGAAVGVGADTTRATARALTRWADTRLTDGWSDRVVDQPSAARNRLGSLAGHLPPVRHQAHPSGMWRAWAPGGTPLTALDPGQAEQRALLAALARRQHPGWVGEIVPGAPPYTGEHLQRHTAALGLWTRPVPLPALVSTHLVGVEVGKDGGRP
ncbi:hypothetical protein O7628_14725 [Micromonospora sp. WMMD956]|uniref:hypothetical protein n=1 Tax=Micromonospora TaxID=1873 RepID=UPI0024163553|nr:hypothetical protein [Micromonospora sp. WMMD956]MDG4816747.1 hypothetical protein [Micromonospora sp. WMMD956]